MNVVVKLLQHTDTNFPCTFSIFNGVRIKITHYIAPINIHSSINGIGVSQHLNICPILTDLDR